MGVQLSVSDSADAIFLMATHTTQLHTLARWTAVVLGVVVFAFSGVMPALHAMVSHAPDRPGAAERSPGAQVTKRHGCSGCGHHRSCSRPEVVPTRPTEHENAPTETPDHECAICVHLTLGKLACGVTLVPASVIIDHAPIARTEAAPLSSPSVRPTLSRSSRGPPAA